jgi:hypothetical protein
MHYMNNNHFGPNELTLTDSSGHFNHLSDDNNM